MTLFNIYLSMTLVSPVFDPYRFLCSPPSRRLHSLLKHASRSSTFILAIHLELILIYVMHEIFFINLNSRFNLICKLSTLRRYLCINSRVIHFVLLASFVNHHLSQMTSSFIFETPHICICPCLIHFPCFLLLLTIFITNDKFFHI